VKYIPGVILAALGFLGPAASGSAPNSDPTAFFRVSSSPEQTTIYSLSDQGWLSWSNTSTAVDYVIERSYTLATPDWAPITRGAALSNAMTVKVFDLQPPGNMRFLPGGTFTMGNVLGDAGQLALPTNSVRVSPFYCGIYEITAAEMASALQWAYEQGRVIVSTNYVQDLKGTNLVTIKTYGAEIGFANGKFTYGPGRGVHPANFVSWFGAVNYCNWLSIINGYDQCYNLDTWECDFSKVGYRLPTEAEWEFAARGGYEGKRFPWAYTDTITHTNANYKSSTNNFYDVSSTRGYHPDYVIPGTCSSPVGAFAPNNYGLYDMSGNVWEWVWDWYAVYTKEPKTDPVGPSAGRFKVFRGGAWMTTAERTTCAVRYIAATPDDMVADVGFRIVFPHIPGK
jgi:formylglycine-generating enzyme